MSNRAQKADCTPIGNPGTVSAIMAEIRSSGPITFERFMELALYHPDFGYYTRTTDANGEERAGHDRIGPNRIGQNRIGWSGDYYTSFDAHPLLARALAKQIAQLDEQLGRPNPLTLVEMGPGKGLLARDFLTACDTDNPSLAARLRYVLIERSPAMVAAQREHLAPWLGTPRISWLNGLADLHDDAVTGALLSNELVDAFPVHRIRMVDGKPKELYVAHENGRFVEQTGPLSTPALADYLQRLAAMDIVLPEGYRTEINLRATAWMKEVARVLGHGVAITIDYGHTAQDFYGPDRKRGTLLCYSRHQAFDDPYARVGVQDMTAHVDFTALAAAGEEAGLRMTGFTNQTSFLMGLGAEQMLAALDPESPELHSAIQLLRPDGMGRTFKILIQHKGMPEPQLDGLKFKPFFGNALVASESKVAKS
jgi:SAM-dependent MidA family methyltransferase